MTKKREREDPSEALASPPVSLSKRSKPAAKLGPEISSGSQAPSNSNAIPGAEEEEDDEEDDDDYTSSSGTSSPSSSSDEEDQSDEDNGESIETDIKNHDNEDTITYVPGRPKPQIHRTKPLESSGLMSRISSFLPQLQAANADLEQKLAGGDTKDIIMDDAKEEEGQYIEMNLGLGVLKEKRDDDSSDSQDDASDSDRDATETSESHVMDRLMGIKSRSKEEAPGIHEVEDG